MRQPTAETKQNTSADSKKFAIFDVNTKRDVESDDSEKAPVAVFCPSIIWRWRQRRC